MYTKVWRSMSRGCLFKITKHIRYWSGNKQKTIVPRELVLWELQLKQVTCHCLENIGTWKKRVLEQMIFTAMLLRLSFPIQAKIWSGSKRHWRLASTLRSIVSGLKHSSLSPKFELVLRSVSSLGVEIYYRKLALLSPPCQARFAASMVTSPPFAAEGVG